MHLRDVFVPVLAGALAFGACGPVQGDPPPGAEVEGDGPDGAIARTLG